VSDVAPPAPGIGVFGKLPGLGDFVDRGLDPEFTASWYAWLAAELPPARAALGARFVPAYMQAPVWRFALPRGAAGPRAMTGVVMPSVDAVGREFPLTLAAEGGTAEGCWYDLVEDAGRAALDDDAWHLEAWLESLRALPAIDGAAGPEKVSFWSDGSPFVPAMTLTWPDLPRGDAFRRLLIEPGSETGAR
jgi:type VI secretion system protein ImpM